MNFDYKAYFESSDINDQIKGLEFLSQLIDRKSISNEEFYKAINPFLADPIIKVRSELVNLMFKIRHYPPLNEFYEILQGLEPLELDFIKEADEFTGWFEKFLVNYKKDQMTDDFKHMVNVGKLLCSPMLSPIIIKFLNRGFENVKEEILSLLINIPDIEGMNIVFNYCNQFDDDSTRRILSNFFQFRSIDSLRIVFYYYDLLKERMVSRVEELFKNFDENICYKFIKEIYQTGDFFLIRKIENLFKHLDIKRIEELKKDIPEKNNTPFILVVDDQVYLRSSVSYILKKKGFIVECANNGKDAVAFVNSRKPHLVLMDVMMPLMDGFEATASIKGNPQTADVSVVMLTAKGTGEDVKKAISCGAVDYIAKPYTIQTIIAKVCRVIYKKHPLICGKTE